MNQICQTVSGESKFASMSDLYNKDLEKMQTASAQTIKIFEEPIKFTRISETASRKFKLPYYASWLPLTLYHYSISQMVSAESEATFKELKMNYLRNRTRMTRITRIFTDMVNLRASASSAQSAFQPKNPFNHASAFICVHLRLNCMELPVGG